MGESSRSVSGDPSKVEIAVVVTVVLMVKGLLFIRGDLNERAPGEEQRANKSSVFSVDTETL